MNEQRRDAQVQPTIQDVPQEHEQPSHPRSFAALRAKSTVKLSNLSTLFLLFMIRAQENGVPPVDAPSHIESGW